MDWSTGWSIRGKQWEAELSKVLSKGYIDLNKYKSNFKTFDFYNPNTKTAISAKSVDTVSSFNGKGGLTSLERQIKGYVNDTLNFRSERAVKNKYKLTQKDIQHREVHIAIPQGTSVDKMKAINNAVNYGKTKGVKVIITETKSR